MGHAIRVNMAFADAAKVQKLGRTLAEDGSLGINQAAALLLASLASGEYVMVKKKAPKPKEKVAK